MVTDQAQVQRGRRGEDSDASVRGERTVRAEGGSGLMRGAARRWVVSCLRFSKDESEPAIERTGERPGGEARDPATATQGDGDGGLPLT